MPSSSTPSAPDDAARLREQALAWFVRRQSGSWTAQDAQGLADWLAADPRHAQALARCQQHWDGFEGMPADLVQRMRAQLRRDQPVPAGVPRRRLLQPAFALAAAAVVTGGAGFSVWRWTQAQPQWTHAFQTRRGQQQSIALPDGSQLRLDTATRVEVAYHRDRREVRLLDGQAFFSVQADAARPFQVRAGPVRVTVVGTRFSVRHTPGQPGQDGVQVAVEQGQVRVARDPAAGDPGALLLTAGQSLDTDAAGRFGLLVNLPGSPVATWREQRLSFLDIPLAQALAELERYADTGLVVRDPAVAALRLTATVDPFQPAALRRALPRILPVRLQQQGAHTEVLPAS